MSFPGQKTTNTFADRHRIIRFVKWTLVTRPDPGQTDHASSHPPLRNLFRVEPTQMKDLGVIQRHSRAWGLEVEGLLNAAVKIFSRHNLSSWKLIEGSAGLGNGYTQKRKREIYEYKLVLV